MEISAMVNEIAGEQKDTAGVKPSMRLARWKSFLFQMVGIFILFAAMIWGVGFVPRGQAHGIPGLAALFGSYACLCGCTIAAIGRVFWPANSAKGVFAVGAVVCVVGLHMYAVEFIAGFGNAGALLGVVVSFCGGIAVAVSWGFRRKRWVGVVFSIGRAIAVLGCLVVFLSFAWMLS